MKARYQQSIKNHLSKSHGLVLLYHSISDDTRLSERLMHNVSPSMFEQHISDLFEVFRFVSLPEFLSAENAAGLAAITFDDGYRNVLTHALPILEEAQIPASLCVNSSVLQGRLNWRDKVRFIVRHDLAEDFMNTCKLPATEGSFYRFSKHPSNNSAFVDQCMDDFLQDRAIEIMPDPACMNFKDLQACSKSCKLLSVVNHGARHYVLSSLTDQQQYNEINEPRQQLSQCSNACLDDVFSVPFGGGQDLNQKTLEIAHEAGYSNLLMSRQQLHQAAPPPPLTQSLRKVERFMPRTDNVLQEIASVYSMLC